MKTHLPICMKKVNYEFTVAGKKKKRRDRLGKEVRGGT